MAEAPMSPPTSHGPMPAGPALESPVVRSYRVREGAALSLADVSGTSKRLVRAGAHSRTAEHLGAPFGTSATAAGGATVLGSRPGEWIVLGSADQVGAVAAELDQLSDPEFCSALDWTHGRAMFRVTGAPAARMLEKVCGLDWSDHMTPDGAVASASVALVTCDLARNDRNGTPSYLILCDRSLGQYLFDALIDAGDEFGISVAAEAGSDPRTP